MLGTANAVKRKSLRDRNSVVSQHRPAGCLSSISLVGTRLTCASLCCLRLCARLWETRSCDSDHVACNMLPSLAEKVSDGCFPLGPPADKMRI